MSAYTTRRRNVFFLLLVAYGVAGFFAGMLAGRSMRDPLALSVVVVWLGLFFSLLSVCND